MSLGGIYSDSLDDAVENSIADGVSYVVGAGNANIDACYYSPARVGDAITVGATTSTDARAPYSNVGACVDLFAPGSDVTSAWNTSDTASNTISGTSMAAPHVTGVAALYLQDNPAASPGTVAGFVNASARTGKVADAGPGSANRLLFFADQPHGFADVNADGGADFCRFAGPPAARYVSCLLALPGGGFADHDPFSSGPGIDTGYPDQPRGFADVNADGRADYCRFVGSPTNMSLSCMLALATGGFGSQYAFTSATGIDKGYPDQPRGFADVNADGRADYCRFVGSPTNMSLSCMLALATGGFGSQYAFTSATGIDKGYPDQPRGFADVNADGRADYCRFVGSPTSVSLSCMLALATGGFGSQYAFTSATGVNRGYADQLRGFADVNADGRADYCRFFGPPAGRYVSCMLALPEGGFGDQYAFGRGPGIDTGYPGQPRAFADVNGDGRADYCRFVRSASTMSLSCMLF